ncbi:MAG TPA: hypothetical protein VFM98_12525 [Ramlibacter sp.]|uniref:hypothetical protein n=1 Tax=Ramlibacter sp. TaxID=1917967 RepID=UPI002D7F1985|nr:hypothetical protein [Ramlibacter sp.]HET8746424.1 hypothetical protein [Ramlibacter sp.]
MFALARSRRSARLVAAWVLLWFAALQATALLGLPPVPTAASQQHTLAAATQHGHADGDHPAQAGHDCDEEAAEHGKGAHTGARHLVQCPGCLFSAAPPPQQPAPPAALQARAVLVQALSAAAPRGEALAQPPARGPPRFS